MSMQKRKHWDNCLTHFDAEVESFISHYFSRIDRRCLLVSGAGFDPRALTIPKMLSEALNDRLSALCMKEERSDPALSLRTMAEENHAKLAEIIVKLRVIPIQIFDETDRAPVAGIRVIDALKSYTLPDDVTDVVLDMSALSLGVGFPTARFLLNLCESRNLNFHLMISSNPELEARIVGEPHAQPLNVRGFSGDVTGNEEGDVARIWLPQLARGRAAALQRIRAVQADVYKVCPILPFPARNPRRSDELLAEYLPQLTNEWLVDARDLIYVSEHNPLDSYRTISTLYKRYKRTVAGIYTPQLILSPLGSRVMAAGAMMAAIEHDITVQYVENLRYEFGPAVPEGDALPDLAVHVWLSGPVYAGLYAN